MPKPSDIIQTVSTLMNDTAQDTYDNTTVLPMLNLSLQILQETFENNGLPVSNKSSATIPVKAGIKKVGFDTNPALPSDLIDLTTLWESPSGLEQWTPMSKKDFIPHQLQNLTRISQFLLYAWKGQAIELIPANSDNDLKLDYIGSIFRPITAEIINVNMPFVNIQTYLEFMSAALCAFFLAENEDRGMLLAAQASDALDRSLGIQVKSTQTIFTRRRPFRASFKRRGWAI